MSVFLFCYKKLAVQTKRVDFVGQVVISPVAAFVENEVSLRYVTCLKSLGRVRVVSAACFWTCPP